MTTLILRADAGGSIGSGHVMRCLALGEHAARAGMRTVIAAADLPRSLAARAEAAGIEVVGIFAAHPDPRDLAAVSELVRRAAAARSPEGPGFSPATWVVVDGYAFDDPYVQALRAAGCRVLLLDDLQSLPRYSADIVLNQNAGAERRSYPLAHGRALLATRYALLRREVLDSRRDTVPHSTTPPRVVVTMGGSDPSNATERALELLRSIDIAAEVIVIVGPANPHGARIAAAARGLRRADVLVDPPDFARVVAGCDLAISAAGTTALDLAYLGVPSVLIVAAENQRPGATAFAEAGAARVFSLADADRSSAAGEVAALVADAGARERLSRRGRQLVDGRGSRRVLQWLQWDGTTRRSLTLRAATEDDSLALWQLANDREVRANSFRPDPIPLADHFPWFTGRLALPDTRMYVLAWGEEIAAQIRYDRSAAGLAEIGFSVAPGFRGEGLGTRILADTWARACHELGADGARGVVFETNEPSRRAFLSAGFGEVERAVVEARPCVIFERRMSVAA